MKARLAVAVVILTAAFFAAWTHGTPTGPIITSINQNQGTTAGGNAVVITGSGFTHANALHFGATSAGTAWWINSDSSITVSTPAASAGTVDITVSNPSGTSSRTAADQFTYVTPSGIPTVTSISPNSDIPTIAGQDGASIVGTNFTGATTVSFGANTATFSVANSTNIEVAIPSGTGTVHVTVTNGSGTSVGTNADLFTYSTSLPTIPSIPATASRPSYNTGNGFFVVGRGIYDANGNLFTPVGANRLHYDNSEEERFATGLNAERVQPYFLTSSTFNSSAQAGLMADAITNFVVPIATIFYTNFNTSTQTTNTVDIPSLQAAYGFFANNATNWTNTTIPGTSFTGNQILWFDLANEWGPCTNITLSSSPPGSPGDFRTGWVGAVQAMRAAGFTAPIVADAGCAGEGADTLNQDAVAIEAADPLHNVIFAIHPYGYEWTPGAAGPIMGCGPPSCVVPIFQQSMAQLSQLTVPVIIEEFGCSQCAGNAGSSPVTSDQIIQTAMTWGMGYLAWGWDDTYGGYYCNNGAITPTCNALQMLGTDGSGNWCYKNMAGTDVTGTLSGTNVGGTYGHDVITFATYGIQAAARVASVFTGTRPAPGTCPF